MCTSLPETVKSFISEMESQTGVKLEYYIAHGAVPKLTLIWKPQPMSQHSPQFLDNYSSTRKTPSQRHRDNRRYRDYRAKRKTRFISQNTSDLGVSNNTGYDLNTHSTIKASTLYSNYTRSNNEEVVLAPESNDSGEIDMKDDDQTENGTVVESEDGLCKADLDPQNLLPINNQVEREKTHANQVQVKNIGLLNSTYPSGSVNSISKSSLISSNAPETVSLCVKEQGEPKVQRDITYQSDPKELPTSGAEAGPPVQLLSSTPMADYRDITFDKLTLDHRDRFYQQVRASVGDLIVVYDVDSERVSDILDPRVQSKGYRCLADHQEIHQKFRHVPPEHYHYLPGDYVKYIDLIKYNINEALKKRSPNI